MKLIKSGNEVWHYQLNQTEFDLLTTVLKQFPLTNLDRVKISRTGKDSKTREREKLLTESLAEHRKELKNAAATILDTEKLKHQNGVWLLTLNSEERELLLQILNDIRVGCWNALGRPEELEPETTNLSAKDFQKYGLMNLAGYFEYSILITE